jgi:DNA-binding NarL/FixJ family response regulator
MSGEAQPHGGKASRRGQESPAKGRTNTDKRPPCLAVIDEDKAVHEAVAEAMTPLRPQWKVVSFFAAEEVIAEFRDWQPQAALVDLCRAEHRGIDCARFLMRSFPGLPVVFHTMNPDPALVMLAVMAGASGLLVKPQPQPELRAAILRVVHGGFVLCPRAQTALATSIRRLDLLTSRDVLSPREKEVLNFLWQGLQQKEIAGALHLTRGTVHAHLNRIYKKLGVHSAKEAIAKAFGTLIPP